MSLSINTSPVEQGHGDGYNWMPWLFIIRESIYSLRLHYAIMRQTLVSIINETIPRFLNRDWTDNSISVSAPVNFRPICEDSVDEHASPFHTTS